LPALNSAELFPENRLQLPRRFQRRVVDRNFERPHLAGIIVDNQQFLATGRPPCDLADTRAD
jgi:hypothetical protein